MNINTKMVFNKSQRKMAARSQRYFVTGVSMITSDGPHGPDAMAAEWTMQISYDPMLIAVFIHEGASTLDNIKKTKEFGVNVASEEQTTQVSTSGGFTRREIDKLKIRDAFDVLKSKHIRPPLIDGCVINAECKLLLTRKIGDHIMVVGKVVTINHNPAKKPLVYHQNRYFRIGPMLEPVRDKVVLDKKTFDLFRREAKGEFILKCVGVAIRLSNKMLVMTYHVDKEKISSIPFMRVIRGFDFKIEFERYLKRIKLSIEMRDKPVVKRLVLKNRSRTQKVNLILFDARLKKESGKLFWKNINSDLLLKALVK